jgi:hypothetical protein
MDTPENIPLKGYYHHYKHDSKGPINNYAYEVRGVGCHTEDGTWFVIYRPLYPEAFVYKAGKHFDIRPLTMFMEEVSPGVPRFKKITDTDVIAELIKKRTELYYT